MQAAYSAGNFTSIKTITMNFNLNLNFAEVIMRYAVLMAIIIVAGALHQYWMVIPAMLVFLTAILGWCPVKETLGKIKLPNDRKKL